ncbi:6-bladed beta-propeller [Albibacterium profundi]|uniref:6-bladed beta-propeller n=1 Tax=Albibacterium profundi TaxID=3134906 RepID=A0ABV5CF05_9SPHI
MSNEVRKTTIAILFVILCIPVSFAQEMIDQRRIPIHQSKGANVEDLFSSVEYIPLENTENSMIQEVDDFWATEDEIIVFDRRGRAILFFDHNGQFKHKIDKVPDCGPCNRAEYLFSSVFVNKEKRKVYAIYGTSMDNVTMGIFDFNGNFLGEKKEWYTLNGMGFIGNSILLAHYFFNEKNLDNIQFFHHDSTTTISYFDPEFKADYATIPNRISKNTYDGKLYWSEPYENTIYAIDSNGNISGVKLIFPAHYSLPNDFVKNNLGKISNVIRSTYPNAIFGITNIMKIGDFMVLNLMSHMSLNGLSSILLDTRSGEVYDLNQIRPSALNHYMPISSPKNQSFFLDDNNEQLYSLVYPQDLIVRYNEGDMMKYIGQTPSYVQDIVKNSDVYRNPILAISSMK